MNANLIEVAFDTTGWLVAEQGGIIDRFIDQEDALKAALSVCDRRFEEGVHSLVYFASADARPQAYSA